MLKLQMLCQNVCWRAFSKLTTKDRTSAVWSWDVMAFEYFYMIVSIIKILSSYLDRSYINEISCFIPILQQGKLKRSECLYWCTSFCSCLEITWVCPRFIYIACRSKLGEWFQLTKIKISTSLLLFRKFGPSTA